MNFFKALFGGKEENPEDKKKAQDEKDFDVLKYDGVRALRSGQHDYAIKCFTHALQMKEDLEIRDYLSQAFVRADLLPEAYDNLLKISEAQPDNIKVYISMANVCYIMEDYTAMAEACEKAILLDNSNAEATYLYAKACIGHGDTTNAIAMLTNAISMKDDYAEAYLLRGETQLEAGLIDDADEDANHLLKDYPESEDVLMLKARIIKAKGNSDEAIEYYGKVIDVNPFHADAYRERGELKLAAGDEKGGNEDIEHANELTTQQPETDSDEGIEKKIKDKYKSMDPYGVF